MACAVAVVIAILAILTTRRLKKVPTSTTQNLVELIVSSLNNFVVGIIGPKGEKYTPFIGTLFIYILCMNLLGLIPTLRSPTSSINITLSLALIVFVTYNVAGIMETGFRRWFRHLLGDPIWLAPLMFPIHLVGEFARPLSLSIRLYGNIFGEETILAVLAGMSILIIPYVVAIPLQFPMMLFAVFTSFIQALVFSTLTTIYISIAVSTHEEGH
jgi:F-type H+-transporting ATPase subunit a